MTEQPSAEQIARFLEQNTDIELTDWQRQYLEWAASGETVFLHYGRTQARRAIERALELVANWEIVHGPPPSLADAVENARAASKPDIITQIDQAVGCQHCHKKLRPDGPSPDFCGFGCQAAWHAVHNGKPKPVEDTSALDPYANLGEVASSDGGRDRAALLDPPPPDPRYRAPHDPVQPCRRHLTEHCLLALAGACQDMPCQRFEVEDGAGVALPDPARRPGVEPSFTVIDELHHLSREEHDRLVARVSEAMASRKHQGVWRLQPNQAEVAALPQAAADDQRGWLSRWFDRIRGNR